MGTVVFPEIFNNGLTLLNGAISDSTTTVIVDSAVAIGLDNSTTDAYVTIIAPSTFGFNPFLTPETQEVVLVTSVSSNTLTVTRGVDGTTGIAFGDNAYVMTRNNAATLKRVYQALTDGTDEINVGKLTSAGDVVAGGDLIATQTAANPEWKLIRTDGATLSARSASSFTSMTSDVEFRIIIDAVDALVLANTTGNATFIGDVDAAGDVSVGGFLNLGAPTELTISSGAVTPTGSYHKIDTEADASIDDLDTINGGSQGDILILQSAVSARDVTLTDNVGNIFLDQGATFILSHPQDKIVLLYDTSNIWVELSRSNQS